MEPLYGNATFHEIDDHRLLLHITFNERVDQDAVHFRAPAPPDHLTSFSGSALPFPNAHVAFENTPNQGTVKVDAASRVTIPIMHPNVYYSPFEDSYVGPHVEIRYASATDRAPRMWKIELPYRAPRFRSLGPPAQRKGPGFYRSRRDATRTQERILRDSAHTKDSCAITDFWCGKPPQ